MPWGRGASAHDLTYLATQATALATVAGARTARYFKPATVGVPSSAIAAWKPEMRYRPATVTFGDADVWCQIAGAVFQETVAQMQLDGVL